jgi:hypothetical protein
MLWTVIEGPTTLLKFHNISIFQGVTPLHTPRKWRVVAVSPHIPLYYGKGLCCWVGEKLLYTHIYNMYYIKLIYIYA